MHSYCEFCNKIRGTLNKTNWKRHVDSCKIKNKKQTIPPSSTVDSITNYFCKKRKVEETIVSGMLLEICIRYLFIYIYYLKKLNYFIFS